MQENEIQSHSTSWLFYVKAAFVISLLAMAAGILFMPATLVVQGYFALSSLFMVSATITMVKTLRDDHESRRLLNRISEAKTSKILKEFAE